MTRYADAALAVVVMAIVGMMIVPLPTALLDVLIVANIALGVLMMLVAMYMPNGLAFTAMPTILLVTTLYRLALNVSSTRLILLQADAGEVIRSFGDFVVRGNYVVGAVVFLILILIQYVVVARGSERVAEVGARFTLDAMPGKQMAIDADLRSGLISAEQAGERRRLLERENQFYGAMDGAMKFVKGDAIAGIAITVINIIAGVGIGVTMGGLDAFESLRIYGLLTIGDGLVSQIPSLLIATAAGVVVTRVVSSEDQGSLGMDIGSQLFGNPRVLGVGAVFLLLLALVPGLPAVPFLVLSGILGLSAAALRRHAATGGTEAGPGSRRPPLPPLRIEFGPASSLDQAQVQDALGSLRERLFAELGVVLPAAQIDGTPAADGVAIRLFDVPVASESATTAAIAKAVEGAVRSRPQDLVGLQETQELLDALARQEPALVKNTVPRPVSLTVLAEVLRRLVAEGVSIRPLRQILQALAEAGDGGADLARLTERVREGLKRQITFTHAAGGVLPVHPLDPMLEEAVRDALQPGDSGSGRYLALPPEQARDIVAAVRRRNESAGQASTVLVTQADVRPYLRELLAPVLPRVAVLSYQQIAPDVEVQRQAAITLGAP